MYIVVEYNEVMVMSISQARLKKQKDEFAGDENHLSTTQEITEHPKPIYIDRHEEVPKPTQTDLEPKPSLEEDSEAMGNSECDSSLALTLESPRHDDYENIPANY